MARSASRLARYGVAPAASAAAGSSGGGGSIWKQRGAENSENSGAAGNGICNGEISAAAAGENIIIGIIVNGMQQRHGGAARAAA
jgi:hypothetical protein